MLNSLWLGTLFQPLTTLRFSFFELFSGASTLNTPLEEKI